MQLERWSIKGRMAFNTDKESWTVTLHWEKEADRFKIRMIAPLGQGTWQLSGDHDHVRLTTEDNHQYEAVSAEALLRQTLGWEVPLQGLEYWVRGIPQPDSPMKQIAFDEQGRMINLQQAGWRISILQYDNIDGTDLPGKLFMSNDHFTLKLVIKDWQT